MSSSARQQKGGGGFARLSQITSKKFTSRVTNSVPFDGLFTQPERAMPLPSRRPSDTSALHLSKSKSSVTGPKPDCPLQATLQVACSTVIFATVDLDGKGQREGAHMPEDSTQADPQQAASWGIGAALAEVARRLTSQPLVFGFGILLLLVVGAGLLADRLLMLVVPALVIFVIGVAVWLAVELPKARAKASGADKDVQVRAQEVGRVGSVVGIEGLPRTASTPQVDIDARRIEGRVVGAGYGQDDPAQADHDHESSD